MNHKLHMAFRGILVLILITVAVIDSLTSILRHRLIGLEGRN